MFIISDISSAKIWLFSQRIKNRIFISNSKWLSIVLSIALGVLLGFLFCGSIVAIKWIQEFLNPYFIDTQHFSELKSLFLSIGGALVSASAIAFSLVMFAMQVNVEKMPYGLFKKFSSDIKLLSAFSITFLISIFIATLSLFPSYKFSVYLIVLAFLGVLLILFLYLFAYRRALKLISPAYQLVLVVDDISKKLVSWDKAATRASLLMKIDNQDDIQHDLARVVYFKQHLNWAHFVKQGILYSNSYARRYSELGDYEVSKLSLNSLLAINSAYIGTKRKTFFASSAFGDNSESVDGVINETLEHLRQNIRIGLSRNDEQFLELNLNVIFSLTALYYTIDYSNDRASKYHAHLAFGYLSNAIEDCVPYNMPDVLMEGIRLLGDTALLEIGHGHGEHIPNVTKKISLVSSVGFINKKLEPVSQIGVEQLVKISLGLLKSNYHEIGYIVEQIREDINFIAKNYLKYQSNTPPNILHHPLSSYYSGPLQSELTDLANAVLASDSDNEDAQRVIKHVIEWSDGIYSNEKDLLLEAIRYKSHFTLDIIQWITDITKLLLAISNSDACEEYERENLRKNAHLLISVFSWIPDDEEAMSLVEVYNLSNYIFESAIDANDRELFDMSVDVTDLLLLLAFKIGKHENQWRNFEKVLSKYIVLNIKLGLDNSKLLSNIKKELLKDDAPSNETRVLVANELKDKALGNGRENYQYSPMGTIMRELDQSQLRDGFKIVSELIVPDKN